MRRKEIAVIKERRAQLGLPAENPKMPEALPVILTNTVGLAGARRITAVRRQELARRFPPAFLQLLQPAEEDRAERQMEVIREIPAAVFPLGRGGILTGLWTLTRELSCALDVDLNAIPIRQETIEICEYFGIDPCLLFSEGCLLIVTQKERVLLSALQNAGIPAAVIGTVSEGADCILTCDGRTRYLSRPEKDPLETIIGGSTHAYKYCSA